MRALIALLFISAGCAPKRKVSVVVPAQCASVKITDFTKPCQPISSSTAVCDGVVVHVSCVRYK